MTAPWLDDACSLVAAFRRKELSPLEALDSCIKAIERSQLNAFSHLDFDHARLAAATADIDLPFGGVPFGVKELEAVSAWPFTSASMAFRYRSATQDATSVARLRQVGAVLVAQTTASELGAVNCTSTRLHGTTRNPWDPNRTPGGSSGGSAAAVAGGLVPIATGSEGGGSIRIPAGFSGLLGLKATHGRIPMGPRAGIEPFTSVKGCLARSVRDTARYFDCCNGFDQRDPYSLPAAGGWESALGTGDLSGMRVAIIPDLNTAQLRDEVKDAVARHGERLAAAAGMRVVDVVPRLPVLRGQWAMASQVGLVADLGDAYPDCLEELSPEVRLGLE
ncbi:MAG: amidase, partial [Acidimicrobiales bacterium]